jgi:hypothetical protein
MQAWQLRILIIMASSEPSGFVPGFMAVETSGYLQ